MPFFLKVSSRRSLINLSIKLHFFLFWIDHWLTSASAWYSSCWGTWQTTVLHSVYAFLWDSANFKHILPLPSPPQSEESLSLSIIKQLQDSLDLSHHSSPGENTWEVKTLSGISSIKCLLEHCLIFLRKSIWMGREQWQQHQKQKCTTRTQWQLPSKFLSAWQMPQITWIIGTLHFYSFLRRLFMETSDN